jgi:hypothetical protein
MVIAGTEIEGLGTSREAVLETRTELDKWNLEGDLESKAIARVGTDADVSKIEITAKVSTNRKVEIECVRLRTRWVMKTSRRVL